MSEQHIHPEPTSFLRRYVFSFDHKVIAKQFLWMGLLWLATGGFMAMLIRWQLLHPGLPFPVVGPLVLPRTHGVVDPHTYTTLFTMHGTIMIFFAITPILIGAFGNLCIPLMIGARDMIFPFLNCLSFWVMVLSSALMGASIFMPLGAPAAGWTAYPPLSTNVGTPGWGQTLWVLAIFIAGVSTIMGAINYITTIIRLRAPGMGYMQMPLTIWGMWMTAILNALFVPVLGSAGILLLLDRLFGTHFYVAGSTVAKGGGDPILFQHLFWIFGHPEVYILILPVWGVVGDLLSFFSRKPAFAYRVAVYAMCAITIISAIVYGHHMFLVGMSPLLGQAFMVLTMIISIPAIALFVTWMGTIWRGSMRLHTPMLYALGVVFVFGLGGLTGLFLGSIETDIYLHDTYFVVGHFHFTMAAAVFLGSFAAISFWFPKMFGRMLDERLGKVHFVISLSAITVIFGTMLVIGYGGMQRRLWNASDYPGFRHLYPLTKLTSYAAFTLGVTQFLFAYNFIKSMISGARAPANPWEVGTLEWSIPSPPAHHNFDVIPHVAHGPHEFNNPEVKGKDWLGQWEDADLSKRESPVPQAAQ
jgi:cytochrome c oxidase subunit 1